MQALILKILMYVLTLPFLAGYRTYLVAAGLLGKAIYDVSIGEYPLAISDFLGFLAALGVRAAVANGTVTAKVPAVVLALFMASAGGFAAEPACQAPIPAECRCVNETGVQCAFASLRTLALRAGQGRLAALCQRCPGPLHNLSEIQSVCQQAGCECECIPPGDHQRLFAFLDRHVTKGHRPCAIGVQNGAHVLIVCHFERGGRVVCLGNNPVNGGIREFTWNDFLSHLQPDGMAYALPCDGGKAAPVKADKPVLNAKRNDANRPAKPAGEGWVWGPVEGFGECWSRIESMPMMTPMNTMPNCPNGQCPSACPMSIPMQMPSQMSPACPNGQCPMPEQAPKNMFPPRLLYRPLFPGYDGENYLRGMQQMMPQMRRGS